MAPKEGNSIVKHGVLDERLNVHGVKNLKVADLSICPDNVGCKDLDMKVSHTRLLSLSLTNTMQVPTYHAPGELSSIAPARL